MAAWPTPGFFQNLAKYQGVELRLRSQLRGVLQLEGGVPWVIIADFINEFRW